jgi:hypothetical protein
MRVIFSDDVVCSTFNHVEDQTHGAVTHFGGKLFHCLAYDAPPYSGIGAANKLRAVQWALMMLPIPFVEPH